MQFNVTERRALVSKQTLARLLLAGCLLTCGVNGAYGQSKSIDTIPDENKHRWLGDKIEETADYALYEHGRGFFSCSMLTFMLVIKNYDDDYEISPNNPRYRAIVEKRIIPFVKKRCKNEAVEYFSVDSFFQGVHLLYTEAEGFKEYKTGHFPGPAVGYRGGRETDLSVRVHDPFGQVSYSERTYPLEDYVSLNKLRKFNKVLVARYEQKKRDELANEIAAEAQRKLEEARRLAATAEAERRRKIEERPRKIEAHRAQASGVLALYKRGAGKAYDFSGYARQQALQDIYAGDFEPFTGGYDSDVLKKLERNYVGMLLGLTGGDMSKQLEVAVKVAGLRLPVMMAYFAYHQAFEEQCYPQNQELPWMRGSRRTDLVTTRGGFEISRVEGQTYVYYVREPFFSAFNKTYNAAQEGNFAQLMTGTSLYTRREFQDDFRKFLKTEGCSSPKVRHLEINLYLAAEWLMSAQELLPPEIFEAPPAPVVTPKPQPEIQKTRPAARKTRLKPRAKNR